LRVAREVLRQSDIIDEAQSAPPGMSTAPGRPAVMLLFGLLVASSLLALLIWLVVTINN
jgi:hypothetical protein